MSIIVAAVAAGTMVAGCSASSTALAGSGTSLVGRGDLPVDAKRTQAVVCVAYGKAYGLPSAFRPTQRPVPSMLPIAGFGPAAASCATTPTTGVTMRALVWRKTISKSAVATYTAQLHGAGFILDPSATAGVRNGPGSFAFGYRPPRNYGHQAQGAWAVHIVIVGHNGSSGLTDIFLD